MKQYKSHKIVSAARIVSRITGMSHKENPMGYREFQLDDGTKEIVSETRFDEAEIGGYYVVYSDGYASYSPAKAFEEGYTEVVESPSAGFAAAAAGDGRKRVIIAGGGAGGVSSGGTCIAGAGGSSTGYGSGSSVGGSAGDKENQEGAETLGGYSMLMSQKNKNDRTVMDSVEAGTFGYALAYLKADFKLARAGWNGKGMWVECQVPDAHSKMTLPYLYLNYPADAQNTPGARVPWTPSQTDQLAEDWTIVTVVAAENSAPASTIPPHQKRVIYEKNELDDKLTKLAAFFENPLFDGLPDDEKRRLNDQHDAMKTYSLILGARIEAFSPKSFTLDSGDSVSLALLRQMYRQTTNSGEVIMYFHPHHEADIWLLPHFFPEKYAAKQTLHADEIGWNEAIHFVPVAAK